MGEDTFEILKDDSGQPIIPPLEHRTANWTPNDDFQGPPPLQHRPIPLTSSQNSPSTAPAAIPVRPDGPVAATASPGGGMPQKIPVQSTPVPSPVVSAIDAHLNSLHPSDPGFPIALQARDEAQAAHKANPWAQSGAAPILISGRTQNVFGFDQAEHDPADTKKEPFIGDKNWDEYAKWEYDKDVLQRQNPGMTEGDAEHILTYRHGQEVAAQSVPKHGKLANFGIDLLQNLGAQFAPQAEHAMEARRAEGAKEKQEEEQGRERQAAEQRQERAQQSTEAYQQFEMNKPFEVGGQGYQMTTGPDGQPHLEKVGTQKPIEVPQGGTLIDPNTQKPVYSAPDRPVSVPAGGELIDPSSGKVVAQGNPKVATETFQDKEYQAWLKSHPNGNEEQFIEDKEGRAATRQANEQARAFAQQDTLASKRQDAKSNDAKAKLIDRAENAMVDVNQPTPAGDYDLTMAFVDATKPSAGFRFTNTELQLIKGLRPIQGSAEAFASGVTKGTFLSQGQRKDMNAIIQRAARQAGGQEETSAPAGADNEVYVKGKLVGHTVSGRYVPLAAQ